MGGSIELLLASLLVATGVSAQRIHSCNNDSIPYRITVDGTGMPDLSCSTPSCFNKISKQGYPNCNHDLLETVCVGETEWTSGLVEINNGTHRTLKTECCTFEGLVEARELKTVLLEAGDTYEGGAVIVRGKERAFDVVKEVRKTVSSDNRVQYVVSIYRMPCSSDVDEFSPYPPDGTSRKQKRQGRRKQIERYYDDIYDTAGNDDYEMMPRMRPRFSRRRMMRRRRPMYEDYYDYEYEIVPKRVVRRRPQQQVQTALSPLPPSDNRLWPVFSQPVKTYDARTAQYENPNMLPMDTSLRSSYDQVQPLPTAPQENSVQQYDGLQPLASMPASGSFGSYPSAPLPPPSQAYASPPQLNSYAQSFPSSNSYATAPSYQAVQQPAYQPAYNPAYQQQSSGGYQYSGGGMNGMFDAMQCFSGDMEVMTSEGKKKMKDLKTGDEVMSIEEDMISFSPVVMFLHRDEKQKAHFNTITTATGEELKLTDEHLIYKTNCNANDELEMVRGKELRVGHCLASLLPSQTHNKIHFTQIVKVDRVEEEGIYAPLTVTGDLFVNRVLVSCHSNLAAKTLQQSFFTIYRSISRSISFVLPTSLVESSNHHDLPFGVSYLASTLDLFVPKAVFV